MPEKVSSLAQVADNIREYQRAVANSDTATPSKVWHWYYLHGVGVGPSKFIGYVNMTQARYDDGDGLNGGATETALRGRFFISELMPADPHYTAAHAAAVGLLAKALNKGYRLQESTKFHEILGPRTP